MTSDPNTNPDSHPEGSHPEGSHPESSHEGLRDRFEDFTERIEKAAIDAEFETGEREGSEEEAKAHVMVRVGRMTLGTIIVIVGIAALPLPGPGWLIIAGGLAILAKDVAWADRLLRYIRKRVPGIPEDGKIPRSSMVTMAVVTLAAVSASLWWTFARGSDEFPGGSYQVAGGELADDNGSLDFADDESLTLTYPGCDPVTATVADLTKAKATVGTIDDGGCSELAPLVAAISGNQVDFGYDTDGIVKWFFADDHLASLSVDGATFDLSD